MKLRMRFASLQTLLGVCLTVYRMMASLRLAVTLLVVLAAVLAWATILEAERGRELAQWYVYTSPWFVVLLGLLGLNILAATTIRMPWRKRQIGFVITHAGLLVLLVGAVQTFVSGIEGRVVLGEAEKTDQLLLTGRSLITVQRPTVEGQISSRFSFTPGAVNWPAGKVVDFGESGGLGLRIVNFYRHARSHIDWVADDKDYDGAALRLELSNQSGQTVAEDWLTASVYGGEAVIGPTKFDLLPITVDSMLEDFVDPPTDELGAAGVLSMHYEGKMYRFRIDDKRGQKVSLGDSGVEVEIVDYYPDGRPTPDGRSFLSRSDKPRNPVLELKIYLPGADAPSRQLAFARSPLLNLDGVYGRECPVKFWYHHADIPRTPGAIFLQAPDGRLLCRTVVAGTLTEPQEVSLNRKIPIGGQFDISVVKQIVHARRDVSFQSVDVKQYPQSQEEAAVQMELSLNGQQRQLWLSRADQEFGAQSILTEQGPMIVSFGYDRMPLGFTLELQDFVRSFNPGRMGNAAFASSVKLLDTAAGADESREISMNAPLSYGKFTFYQSSFQELPGDKEVSVLTAAYDPGRLLKYAGSLMICVGIFVMFSMRAYMFQNLPASGSRRRTQSEAQPEAGAAADADRRHVVPKPLGLWRAKEKVDEESRAS